MSVRIGGMRRRLALEEPVAAPDGLGGRDVTWAPVAVVWARLRARSGGEKLRADAVSGRLTHEATIRWRPGVKPYMRFRDGDRVLAIMSVADDERRRFVICECEEGDL